MKATLRAVAIALALGAAGELPTEFRLFVAGWNETENGNYLFDADAATAVMAAFDAQNVDRMIDLEHLSLNAESKNFDPDARGWCRLELRDDGSLWAVHVSWTTDGAERLTSKKQRYVSPAFEIDPKTKRVTKIINIALTALPATHDTPALVAASARDLRKLSAGAAFSDVMMAIGAALGDRFPPLSGQEAVCGPWVVDVFDATFVFELEGKLYEVPYSYDGSVATIGAQFTEVRRSYVPAQTTPAPSPAAQNTTRKATLSAGGNDNMALDAKMVQEALDALTSGDTEKAAELLKGIIAAAASGGQAPPPPPAAGDQTAKRDAAAGDGGTAPGANDAKDPMMAAARVAMSLTGKATPGEAMEELSRRSAIAVEMESREAKLAADRAALETNERRTLVAQLVKLGVEIPATAWSDDKGTVPVKRLADEPIAELRARVAKLSTGRPSSTVILPPADGTVADLTERELEICREKGLDPAAYAKTRAGIRARSTARNTNGTGA